MLGMAQAETGKSEEASDNLEAAVSAGLPDELSAKAKSKLDSLSAGASEE